MGCHFLLQCMKVKSESEVAQSCPTLTDPVDCSLPGSSVHGIFQARILECVAMLSSRGSTLLRDQTVSLTSPALQVDSLPLLPKEHINKSLKASGFTNAEFTHNHC